MVELELRGTISDGAQVFSKRRPEPSPAREWRAALFRGTRASEGPNSNVVHQNEDLANYSFLDELGGKISGTVSKHSAENFDESMYSTDLVLLFYWRSDSGRRLEGSREVTL